jgi:hypothetical protein
MRPPVCDVCDRDLANAGGSVRFQPRPSDTRWRERAAEPGFVGHPPDTGWFCAQHVEAARELAGELTIDAALRALTDAGDDTARGSTVDDLGGLERHWRDRFAEVAERIGLGAAEVQTSEDRRWTPMDGTQPPWCPFVLTSLRSAAVEGQSLELRYERAHWSEDDLARASVELLARGAHDFTLRADAAAGSAVSRSASGPDVAVIADLVEPV